MTTDPAAIERIEVERTIPAGAGEIFRLLTSPQGHVAIDSSGMLLGATGDTVRAVGDTFVVHMDREALNDYPLGRYDVTVSITAFEQDREIAWSILGQLQPPIGHVYGYRLEPVEDGTLVTSYYDWSDIHPQWREAGIFPVLSEGALRATLGVLARTVAGAAELRGSPAGGARLVSTVLGAPDPQALAAFYEQLLGWTRLDDSPEWVKLRPPAGGMGLSFQLEADHVPPVWPAGPGDQAMQIHLDIRVDDLEEGVGRAVAAGATLAGHQPQDDVRVLLDPAGHPFCLFVAAG